MPKLDIGIGNGMDITTGTLKLPLQQLIYPNGNTNTWTSPSGTTFQLPTGIPLSLSPYYLTLLTHSLRLTQLTYKPTNRNQGSDPEQQQRPGCQRNAIV